MEGTVFIERLSNQFLAAHGGFRVPDLQKPGASMFCDICEHVGSLSVSGAD